MNKGKIVDSFLICSVCFALIAAMWFASRSKETPAISSSNSRAGQKIISPDLTQTTRPTMSTDSSAHEAPTAATPPDSETIALSGTSGSLRSSEKFIRLIQDDGLFDRVIIKQGEPVDISINLNSLLPGVPVFITAPDGGNLERQDGLLEFTASKHSENLNLRFNPLTSRGAYTIHIQHGGESLIVDLWAGALNPRGEAGENYIAPVSIAETP